MQRFLTFFVSTALVTGVLLTQSSMAQSLQEIQEYCQSMNGEGINDEDARAYIEECINEQKSYLDQESYSSQDSYSSQENYEAQEYTEQESVPQDEPSDYQNESYSEESTHYQEQEQQYEQDSYTPDNEYQEQNCYTKVDEQIQKLLDNDPNAPFDYDQMLEQCSKGNF